MKHHVEMEISGLTVRIDRTLCVGFGDCVTGAPAIFELDDEGIAVFRAGAEAARATLLHACDACPVDAITVEDQDGTQLVP